MRYLLLTLADWLEWRYHVAYARSAAIRAYVEEYDITMGSFEPQNSDRVVSAVVYGLCLVALSIGVLWVRG